MLWRVPLVAGARGHQRVLDTFSLDAFARKLDTSARAILQTPSRAAVRRNALMIAVFAIAYLARSFGASAEKTLLLTALSALALLFSLP
jgi:hypothetical protein